MQTTSLSCRWLATATLGFVCWSVGSIREVQADASTREEELQIRASAIHAHVLTLDSHVDVLLPPSAAGLGGEHRPQASLEQLREGGIDALALAVAVGPGPRSPEGVASARAEADAKLQAINGFVVDNASQVSLALSVADVRRIHRQGKIAVIISFLNARSLGKNLDAIDDFYTAGVRLFGFTHAGNNDFADSSRPIGDPAQEFHGLSPLGRQAVAKLNSLGVIVDVSQLTPEGVLQTLAISKAPVVASHSAVRALVESPRNLSDRELDAIKSNGGVVQVTAYNIYLVPPPSDYREQVRALRVQYGLAAEFPDGAGGPTRGAETLAADSRQAYTRELSALYPKASVRDYVDHIDYIVRRIGIDHVGIGTDFNHGAGIVGFGDESQAPAVTLELVRRGYTEKQIAKIWGGNFLRVFSKVEAVARTLRHDNGRAK